MHPSVSMMVPGKFQTLAVLISLQVNVKGDRAISLMISLHNVAFVTLCRSMFDIFLGYTMFTALLSILIRNASSAPPIVLLVVQISVLYRNTLPTKVLNTLILMWS